MPQPLKKNDRLERLPKKYVGPDDKKKFERLYDLMDEIGRVDDSDELYVDEVAFRKLLRQSVPRTFEDHCIETLASLPDNKLIKRGMNVGNGRLQPTPWETIDQRCA